MLQASELPEHLVIINVVHAKGSMMILLKLVKFLTTICYPYHASSSCTIQEPKEDNSLKEKKSGVHMQNIYETNKIQHWTLLTNGPIIA